MSLVEKARIASYRAALASHGITLLAELAGDYSYASGRALAQQIDVEATGAVFCTSDAMAMACWMRTAGIFRSTGQPASGCTASITSR
jgi:DNA-binding LacI/PurR family transcriptional regulator